VRGHPLQQGRRCRSSIDADWQRHEFPGRNDREFGVSPDDHRVSDTIAGLEFVDTVPDGLDDARRLRSRSERLRQRIQPGSVIDVDKIDPDRLDPDQDLP
jgi:hypothetical protein